MNFDPVSRLRRAIDEDPIILAHHPFCDRFSGHTVVLRGYHVCLGCLFTYPMAAVTLVLLLSAEGAGLPHPGSTHLFLAGVLVFGASLARKLVDGSSLGLRMHVAFRMALGASLALVLAAIIEAPDWTTRAVMIASVLTVAAVYNFTNGRRTLRTCASCEQHASFPRCEGARPR